MFAIKLKFKRSRKARRNILSEYLQVKYKAWHWEKKLRSNLYLNIRAKREKKNRLHTWSLTRKGPSFESQGLVRSQTQKGPGFETKSLSGARREKGQASRPTAYLEPEAKRARLRGRGFIWRQTRKRPGFEAERLSGARREKGQTLKPRPYLEADTKRARL